MLGTAQDPRWHHYQSFEKCQHAVHRDPQKAKRKQDEPDQRIEQQCDDRKRPAQRKQDEPEQEFDQAEPPWDQFYSVVAESQQGAEWSRRDMLMFRCSLV